jgi:hypothetical protein
MTREVPVRYEIRLRTVLSPALRFCLAPCGRWSVVHRHTITRFSVPEKLELDDLYQALLAHNLEVISIRRA